MRRMMILYRVVAAMLPFVAASSAAQPARISAEAFDADVDFVLQTVVASHPDLRFSSSLEALQSLARSIKHKNGLTRDEAWREMAKFNPLFADAHLFVGFPEWRTDTAAHLAAGGKLFPYEVRLGSDGSLMIESALGGEPTKLGGARIVSINGVPAEKATAALLQRMHGDTPAFRGNLLSQRWWLYHWKMYGAARLYKLGLTRAGKQWTIAVPGSGSQPALLQQEASFDRQFRLETQRGCTAVMRLASFDGAHAKQFAQFSQTAFARLQKENISTLVIDISANGGGDDALWLDNLMPYLATAPYRTGSTYLKRVLEARPERGESAGQIVPGVIETWHAPPLDNPLRFQGKVFVMIGPSTYSSAILFANVMHDFGFATLTGAGGAARRAQTGGVRKWVLPNSQLAVWVPRFVMQPPVPVANEALLETGDPAQIPACDKT